ncbi:unnamed protein product [Closterium sp. NIES-65]|nr:unnamed protein product [Closterium sp. NIES-65]
MASPSVLTFDVEGRAADFEVWVDDLQLFLQCDRADGLSLFDLTSGASPAPAADADATVRSQWATRDAADRLAVPATYRPLSVHTLAIADLITHLRTSDTRYRAALPAEFCANNSPPTMYITLYYIVSRLPDSLRVVRDHFLSVWPTTLTVDLLEKALLAAEKSIVTVGASRGDPRTPIFEWCSPSPPLALCCLCCCGRPRCVEGDCYLCVPPDPGIEATALGAGKAAALGASASAAPGASASAGPGASAPAAPGAGESALSGTTSAQAFHTFTVDSGASRSFFRDRTTLTPLSRPVAVSLADPSGGPLLASFSTALPCPAAPSGTLSGLYLPSFSTNLVSGADLQDRGVDQFTLASQRVTHCTCARTGRYLATFTRRPGSSLYTLTTDSPPAAESGQVAASSQVFAAVSRSGPESAPFSCHLLSHQTLLWHHRLGHPSLPRLRGMASRVLVPGLPQSLPPLPLGPGPTYVPCVEGRQRAVRFI